MHLLISGIVRLQSCDDDVDRGLAFRIATPVMLVVAQLAIGPANAAGGINQGAFESCRTIPDQTERLRCFEKITSGDLQPRSGSQLTGGWRLVRTPNPQGGKDAVSVMHSAELSGSDLDFAGLMFRCADPTYELLIVLIRPLPLRARPKVHIGGETFEASVVPPGAALLLPPEASLRAQERWRSLATISIIVEAENTLTNGLVSLEGLSGALQALAVACRE